MLYQGIVLHLFRKELHNSHFINTVKGGGLMNFRKALIQDIIKTFIYFIGILIKKGYPQGSRKPL